MNNVADFSPHRVWAEVNLEHLAHNYDLCKGNLPHNHQLIAVVKANAYGHGAEGVARHLNVLGCDYFAVSSVMEAIALRQGNVTGSILIMGYTNFHEVELLAKFDLIATIYSLENAIILNEQAHKLGVIIRAQIKIDSGMGRQGWQVEQLDIEEQILSVNRLDNLIIEGIYTHLCVADSDNAVDRAFTNGQVELFEQLVARLISTKKVSFLMVHCCNSAGAYCSQIKVGNATRVGICLYGLSPTQQPLSNMALRPIMSLKSTITHIKQVKANQSISYARTFVASHDMTVATVSIGYADGYNRLLSNRGYMSVNGCLAPVVGRVTMDYTMLNVTGIDCKVGGSVVVFGTQSSISIDHISKSMGTINYEVACGVSARVPRVYIIKDK